MINELIWKARFIFWFLCLKGYKYYNTIYAVETCYIENTDGKHKVLTPKSAAREFVGWCMK